MTIANYLPLLILALLSGGVVAGILWLGHKITPHRPNPEKNQTYECGETPVGSTRRPIDIKYYIYALVFLVIDVEVVFLLPWAVEFRNLGSLAFAEMMVFVAILLVGWAYVWKEGFLRWLR